MSCTLRRCKGKYGCICPKNARSVEIVRNVHASNLPVKSKENQLGDVQAKRLKSVQKINSRRNTSKITPCASNAEPLADSKSKISVLNEVDSVNISVGNEDNIVDIAGSTHNGSGEITICYNHYKNKFPIANSSTTAFAIDAEYCLSFVFPNCKIHLCDHNPVDINSSSPSSMVAEFPEGRYSGLISGNTYWVSIEEDNGEKEAYERRQESYAQEQASKRAVQEMDEAEGLSGIVVEKKESCSCIEGNPCVESYCCKNWSNRFEVAKKHGWKGFS